MGKGIYTIDRHMMHPAAPAEWYSLLYFYVSHHFRSVHMMILSLFTSSSYEWMNERFLSHLSSVRLVKRKHIILMNYTGNSFFFLIFSNFLFSYSGTGSIYKTNERKRGRMKHTKITRQVDSFRYFFCRRCLLLLTFIPKRKKRRKKEEKFKIRFHLRIRKRRDTNLCNDFLEFKKKLKNTETHFVDPMAIIIRIRKELRMSW